jgi:hypothetical protein
MTLSGPKDCLGSTNDARMRPHFLHSPERDSQPSMIINVLYWLHAMSRPAAYHPGTIAGCFGVLDRGQQTSVYAWTNALEALNCHVSCALLPLAPTISAEVGSNRVGPRCTHFASTTVTGC